MHHPVTPIAYALTIEPDLDRFTFAGRVRLDAMAVEPVDRVTLDCAELAIWDCRLENTGAGQKDIGCAFTMDPDNRSLTVRFPGSVVGAFQVSIDYVGKINDRMAGFYRSKISVDNGPDHMAVTQFQESDARRAFPCFDHPARKAVFTVEMVIDNDLAAISNMDVERMTPLDDGRKRVTFEPTPKMSTYLLFFGVGPFEIHTDAGDDRVRSVCLPGQAPQTAFGREFGRKALAYGEAYYAIDYALKKMDLIAVPDFAFGAMENWGAITFRENLLLNVPGVTSREARARICEIIAHEVTHQWFGNLVTPQDWTFLWLNESFATYFGYGMVDHYYPQWKVWHQFVRSHTETALTRDALHETFAIEMPGDARVAINTSTAPIIYSKGGSVLRQLEAWIGPDHFQAGLRRYLTDYAYGCAASSHLWDSLAGASGMPVIELMRNWITQPGFPLITVQRSGNRLTVRQERFSYLPGDGDQTWMVPLTIETHDADGNAESLSVLLRERQADIMLTAGTASYKLNPDQTGFYHVHDTDTDNWNRLAEMIREGKLTAVDRWGLQNDLYALVKSGRADMTAYLRLAENYSNEKAYLPLSSLNSHLFDAYLLLQGEMRKRIGRTAVALIETALDTIGLDPVADEPLTTAMLRDQLFSHGSLMGSDIVLAHLLEKFHACKAGTPLAPDIFRSVMIAGAVAGGRQALDTIIGRFESSDTEHERSVLTAALGAFRKWPHLEQALAYTLDTLPDRLRFLPLAAAAGNPSATERLWPWFEANLPRIEPMHPLLFERVVAAFIPGPGLQDPQQTRRFSENLIQRQPHLKDVISLSLERLEINVRFRKREPSGAG